MGKTHPDDPMRGQLVDDQGRCVHHHEETDVVCFRFPDSGWRFWACRQCHDDANGAPERLWGPGDERELAVQCGICRSILGVHYYLERQDQDIHACPHCHAPWNPKCVQHRDRYFAL